MALPTIRGPASVDGVFQQEPLALEHAVAQPFVGGAAFVGGLGGAGEPPLVDAAAVRAQGVPVGRGQLDPLAGVQEVARHPGRRQPQQSPARLQGPAQNRPYIIPLHDLRRAHGCTFLPTGPKTAEKTASERLFLPAPQTVGKSPGNPSRAARKTCRFRTESCPLRIKATYGIAVSGFFI